VYIRVLFMLGCWPMPASQGSRLGWGAGLCWHVCHSRTSLMCCCNISAVFIHMCMWVSPVPAAVCVLQLTSPVQWETTLQTLLGKGLPEELRGGTRQGHCRHPQAHRQEGRD